MAPGGLAVGSTAELRTALEEEDKAALKEAVDGALSWLDENQSADKEEFEARRADKLHYQYPGGESYMDVIQRLEPVITELERQRVPILIVAHQAILRALTAYLKGQPLREAPHLPMPLHTLLALTPHSYGCHEERRPLLAPAARSSGPGAA